jgi:hypothetical protein
MDILLALLLLSPLQVDPPAPTPLSRETEYTKRLAEELKCKAEAVMPDGSRCDLLTDTHAIEVEWAYKWKEAPAQAVLYAIWTGKEPGVLLLVKDPVADKVEILRCKMVCERLKISMTIRDPRQL